MFFPIFLIIIGIVFLLKNMGLVGDEVWGYVWPIFFIIWGVSMLMNRNKLWAGFWRWSPGYYEKKEESKEDEN